MKITHLLTFACSFIFLSLLSSCGVICLNPDGACTWEIERGWNKRIEIYSKQANAGDTLAQRHLGISLLSKSNYDPGDYREKTHHVLKGIEWLEKSANQKDPLAQYELGKALITGIASRSGYGPEAKDESTPGSEIKKDFDRGIDLIAKTSQLRCYAYGNKTVEVNFELAKFYNYPSYGRLDTYKYDTWRLRHFLYCSDEPTHQPWIGYSEDERGRFSGIMTVVDYLRKGSNGPINMEPIELSLRSSEKDKLLLLSKKYQDGGWSNNQIANYAEKLLLSTHNLNYTYPLSNNFIIYPAWD
jgi:hypothetical protein